jgi:hypothetical protein
LWDTSSNNNPYLKTDAFTAVVFPVRHGSYTAAYRACIVLAGTSRKHYSQRSYCSAEAAKEGAFGELLDLLARHHRMCGHYPEPSRKTQLQITRN